MQINTEQFIRTEWLIGQEGLRKLADSHVAVFGLGGVGGYVVEALARAGVGELSLIDKDDISVSNLNRQILALNSTVGKPKTEVAAARVADINPEIKVHLYQKFFLPENANEFPFSDWDYVVDAIDTVTAKITLVERSKAAGVPIICSMGTGNKLHPEMFEIADISKTSVCPLAKVMRRELKARGIAHVKVVYSKETPLDVGQRTPGSISFVPPVAGLILAGEVIKDLTAYGINREDCVEKKDGE